MRKAICYIVMLCLAAAVVYEVVRACRGNDAAMEQRQLTAGDYRGHDYVDLQLPSQLKWATCNVGAVRPEEPGNYYSWGETETKSDFSAYKYMDSNGKLTKYNVKDKCGATDGRLTLTLDDDAAHCAWGGSWRMPTPQEAKELWDYCQWKDTVVNGRGVTMVTGRNGQYMLLPHAGYRTENGNRERTDKAYIWTATADENECSLATVLGSECAVWAAMIRNRGLNVRAVAR